MRILAINGSPRGEKSNTHVMVTALLKGAKDAGAETENVFLSQKKIAHCLGCFACWQKTPGQCVHQDDMTELLVSFVQADIVMFAFPLYVDNVPGLLKNFMDRTIPIMQPQFDEDDHQECVHRKRWDHYPKIVVVSNCGFPEMSHFQVVQHLFRRVARNMHSEVIAEIYRPAGELLRQRHLALQPFLVGYKKALKQAGKAIVEQGFVPENLQNKLEQPLIPNAMYIKMANQNFTKALQKEE